MRGPHLSLGLIIYGSLDAVSGGYLYDRKLVEFLSRQGDRVQVISLPWRNYARRLGDNLSRELLRTLEEARFDLLLQDELNHPSLFYLNRRLGETSGYPIISIVHHLRCSESHPGWLMRIYRYVERRYLESVDGFVLNSRATRDSVLEMGIDLGSHPSVIAIPGGGQLEPHIQEAEIGRRSRAPGPLRLVAVGNVIPRKGLHTLIEALGRLPAGTCTLTVIGNLDADKGYTRRIRAQIARTGLGKHIQLCGALEAGDLASRLRSQQVMVVPSSYEGYGIVYLEGMGFGLPAIGTTGGGAGEIITPDRDGYLIEPGDVDALTGRLAELAVDRQRLESMSLAARQRYLGQPSWEDSGKRIRDFLLAALETG